MRLRTVRYGFDSIPKQFLDIFEKTVIEVQDLLASIEEDDIVSEQENYQGRTKSVSKPLTNLIEDRLKLNQWTKESRLFSSTEENFQSSRWSVDFIKNNISLEVAFNHEEGTAWNIIKGYISYKPHKMLKSTNTFGSIIITATNDLKRIGGFDGSIGSFEKYLDYMKVFEYLFEYPVILIGLEGPDTFFIKHKNVSNKKLAKIVNRG